MHTSAGRWSLMEGMMRSRKTDSDGTRDKGTTNCKYIWSTRITWSSSTNIHRQVRLEHEFIMNNLCDSTCITVTIDLHCPRKTEITDLSNCQLEKHTTRFPWAFIRTRIKIVETRVQGRRCRTVRDLMRAGLLFLPYPNIIYLSILSADKCDIESETMYLSRKGEDCSTRIAMVTSERKGYHMHLKDHSR